MTPLPALLARCAAVAPAEARSALGVAAGYLATGGAIDALRDAASALRGAYDLAAGRGPVARHVGYVDRHAERFRHPWTDPVADAPALRPLAACVAALYAVEAAATGERPAVVGYYVRACEGWL